MVDSGNNRLSVFTVQGKFVKTIGKEGKGEGEFMNPRKICLTKDNYLLITDSDNNRVQIFDARVSITFLIEICNPPQNLRALI